MVKRVSSPDPGTPEFASEDGVSRAIVRVSHSKKAARKGRLEAGLHSLVQRGRELVLRAPPVRALTRRRKFSGKTSLNEYADQWIERRVRTGFKSEGDYRSMLDKHILPQFGRRQLRSIRRGEVRDWVEEMTGSELAPRSVNNIYGALRTLMKRAERDGLIGRSPCTLDHTERPENEDKDPGYKKKAIYSPAEVRKLLAAPNDPRWRTHYYALFYTGARSGELLGLRWENVDLDMEPLGQIVLIENYNSKRGRVQTLKTKGFRDVPIHPELARQLRAWRELYPSVYRAEPSDAALVFPAVRVGKATGTRSTQYMRSGTVLQHLQADLQRLGLRKRCVHHARRTLISAARNTEGLKEEIFRRITHARKRDVVSGYHETPWAELCREMAKVRYWEPSKWEI